MRRKIIEISLSTIIAVFVVAIMVLVNIYYASRGCLAFLGIFGLLWFIYVLISGKGRVGKYIYKYNLLLFFAIISTLIHVIILNFDFSVWQLLRSQLWPFFGLLALPLTIRFIRNNEFWDEILNFVSVYFIMMSILILFELILGYQVTPAYLRRDFDGLDRLYPIGKVAVVPFIPVFLKYDKQFALLAGFLILGVTGGKSDFALILIVLMVYYMIHGFKYSDLFFFGFISIFMILYFQTSITRFYVFFEQEEGFRRLLQVEEALKMWLSNIYTFLFGIGYGIPYGEGYFGLIKGDLDSDYYALYQNSMYDVENGFFFWLMRSGLIGFIFCLLIMNDVVKGSYKMYFYVIIAIYWLTTSGIGPNGLIFFVSLGAASELYNRTDIYDRFHCSESLRLRRGVISRS